MCTVHIFIIFLLQHIYSNQSKILCMLIIIATVIIIQRQGLPFQFTNSFHRSLLTLCKHPYIRSYSIISQSCVRYSSSDILEQTPRPPLYRRIDHSMPRSHQRNHKSHIIAQFASSSWSFCLQSFRLQHPF